MLLKKLCKIIRLQPARPLLQMHFKRLESCCYDAKKEAAVNDFTTKLVGHLREGFTVPSGMRPLNRDRLWKSFFSIRSSSSFIARWTAFLESASVVATPVLYQHLAALIFRMLIRQEYLHLLIIRCINFMNYTCFVSLYVAIYVTCILFWPRKILCMIIILNYPFPFMH